MGRLFPELVAPSVPVVGVPERFPVRRIFCIGRNYADHAKEMGLTVDREDPTFFTKPADAIVVDSADVPYPSATKNLHHEVEMVVALGSGGTDVPVDEALSHVVAYGVGLDLTRRDLQARAREKGMPWDTAKAFDASAPISSLRLVRDVGHVSACDISLAVDGVVRQKANTAAMIFDVAEIIHLLSGLFELRAGDLIFTGTPAGVGPLERGQRFVARLGDIAELHGRMV